MEKEFVPYEQALALKELGFDEPCFGRWWSKNELDISPTSQYDAPKQVEPAPTFSQAFRWFREKYQIDSCIHRNGGMNIDERGFLPYYEVIIRHNSPELKCVKYSYEEAELECLKKLIEIVKEKK
jgi:hypothetical protein